MLRKVQLTAALILIGILSFVCVNRCGLFRILVQNRRVMLNEQWITHIIEKKYAAAEVELLAVSNIYTGVSIKRTERSGDIIVRIAGLPDTALDITVDNHRLRVDEKDIWHRAIRRVSDDRDWGWYIDADITIEIPKDVRLTEMEFDIQSAVQLNDIEAGFVRINDTDGTAFTARCCRFDTLDSAGNIVMDIADTDIRKRLILNSHNRNIHLKNISAPVAEITAGNSAFHADNITFDELVCRVENGSCKVTGTVTKNAAISTEHGAVSLKLHTETVAETVSVRSSGGSISLGQLAAQTADIKSQYGSIRLDRIRFDTLECRADSGAISLNGIITKRADITSINGSIMIDLHDEPVAEHIKMRTQYGSISAKNISAAAADIQVDNGSFKGDNCTLTDLSATVGSSLSFNGDLSGTNRLTSRYGSIILTLIKPESEYAIASGRKREGTTAAAVGNITIERSSQSPEEFPIIAGSANAPNKLFLSADNGKITIRTK